MSKAGEETGRAEHLQWCKDRAIEYVKRGDLTNAFASMCSDVEKHEETAHHRTTNQLGMMLMLSGKLNSQAEMERWINGYR